MIPKTVSSFTVKAGKFSNVKEETFVVWTPLEFWPGHHHSLVLSKGFVTIKEQMKDVLIDP